jgi:hypothetical protein
MEPAGHGLPLNEYYKEGVIDFWTISNVSGWWTALVYHIDPKTERKILSLYRWRRRGGEWKNMGCVRIKNKDNLSKLTSALEGISLD